MQARRTRGLARRGLNDAAAGRTVALALVPRLQALQTQKDTELDAYRTAKAKSDTLKAKLQTLSGQAAGSEQARADFAAARDELKETGEAIKAVRAHLQALSEQQRAARGELAAAALAEARSPGARWARSK